MNAKTEKPEQPARIVRTKRGAVRRYNAIIAEARRAMRGGLAYGMDWPTFRAVFPDAYAEIQALRSAYPELPD